MFIITTYPLHLVVIERDAAAFTYFYKYHLKIGAIINVPFGRKIVPAIVIKSERLESKKMAVKKGRFELKKISSVISKEPVINPSLIEISEKISKFFLSIPGAVLKSFIPQIILKKPNVGGYNKIEKRKKKVKKPLLITGPLEKRVDFYKKEFKKYPNESIWIIVPTISLGEYLSRNLETKNRKTILIHTELPSKTLLENWKEARDNKNTLIIGTPLTMGALNNNIGLLIIENPNSRHWRQYHMPYLNLKTAIKFITGHEKIDLIEGSAIALVDDLYEKELNRKIIKNLEENKFEKPLLVKMNYDKEKMKEFPIISKGLEKNIKKTNKVILFVNRRGYSPIIICRDCGNTFLCSKCNAPITLHKKTGDTKELFCHHCLERLVSNSSCPVCKSWNLSIYGIGIQRVEEEIKNLFPNIKIMRMDSDSIKNEKERKELTKKFLESKEAILIGTEMILEEPELKASSVGIISIDNLFSLPDFKINENIVRLLSELKQRAKILILQTFLKDNDLFGAFQENKIPLYLKKELNERKITMLPPFTVIIKLTTKAKDKQKLLKRVDNYKNLLKKITKDIESSPAFISKEKNLFIWHINIRVNPYKWLVDENNLRNILKEFNKEWSIIIDPFSIL